ncbi:cyclic GMP-AMP synthase-like [Tribolium madens]|uniref:cyclic GMP-AMP synthase-like n=1 Tax=Tribolium madens TaxID=41895 RepID=UPI001CF7456D|nr:cyclic GMP-AMP synthase-like [Tribolium madens]XP_044252329.1 cyclic GMP-AMP synthase-like [Tribolium madens]XP_044252336.1 cyclic GMP-AMP synthase-like [Tribolium madens]
MENILTDINRRFISLPEEDVRGNKQILESVLRTFVDVMKTQDPLFEALFRRVFYGGSFYDGLRVGKPVEFDLDLLLHIPTYAQPTLQESNIPGFVWLKLNNLDGWLRQPEGRVYKDFRKKFLDNCDFLDTGKTLKWMESLVQKTLNKLPWGNVTNEIGTFCIKWRKGGPAMTLEIFHSSGGKIMDVDLVACFIFGGDKWPINGYRSNPCPSTKPEFFIVPKKPSQQVNPQGRYWRLSFQEQERVLIDNKNRLKPAVKLIKKLKETTHPNIASYYIKTVFLHIIAQKDHSFWNKPLNEVFMTTLREYREFIAEGEIPYYWCRNNNLIGHIDAATLFNISNRIGYIIRDIENNPMTVAKHLLTKDEYQMYINGEDAMAKALPAVQPSNCAIL